MSLPSPYLTSPFRLLGLPASATCQEIEEASKRVRSLIEAKAFDELYEGIAASDLPWLEELRPTPQEWQQACETLQDLTQRLYCRAFWWHGTHQEVGQAMAQLTSGDWESGRDILLGVWHADAERRIFASHNLAVCYHSRSLAAPRGKNLCREDIREAVRWWGHVVDGRQLATIIADGESFQVSEKNQALIITQSELPDDLVREAMQQVLAKLRSDIARALSYGRFRSFFDEEEGEELAGMIPLLSGTVVTGTLKAEGYYTKRAAVSLALERAGEASRQGDYQEADEHLSRAKESCSTANDNDAVDEARLRLGIRRVMRGMKYEFRKPLLTQSLGTGSRLIMMHNFDEDTRSFEARVVMSLLFIPLWMVGRYRVRQNNDEEWEFLGKAVFDPLTLMYNLAVIVFIVWLTASPLVK